MYASQMEIYRDRDRPYRREVAGRSEGVQCQVTRPEGREGDVCG